jgi:dipeptidyl aminopeptidase/acylaminoacyl peptidase
MLKVIAPVLFVAACLGCFLVVPAPILAAPPQAPLRIEDAMGVLSLSNRTPIALSPDGELVAYTVEDDRKRESTSDPRYMYYTRTGAFTEAVGCDIWMTNTKTGTTQNLTEGKGTSWAPVWSPDGRYLAFYSDRSGVAHLWIWVKSSGQLRQLSDAIVRPFFNFQVVRWTPDSGKILLKVLPAGMTVEQAADLFNSPAQSQKDSEKKGNQGGPSVLVYKNIPAAQGSSTGGTPAPQQVQNETWMQRYLADLAVVDVATGQIEHIIKNIRPLGYWISPDGKLLAYMHWKGVRANTQQAEYDLDVFDLNQRSSRTLVSGIHQEYGISVSWSPNSQTLAYMALNSDGNGDCFVVPAAGGDPMNLTPGKHPSFASEHRAPLWDASGEYIYLLSTETYGHVGTDTVWRASVRNHTFAVAGQVPDRIILEAVGPSCGGRIWSPDDGRSLVVATRNEETKEAGYYKIDLQTGKASQLFEEKIHFNWDLIFKTDTSRDGKTLVYVADDAQDPEDVWATSHEFQNRRRVTNINPGIHALSLGAGRVISWRSTDGAPLRGALLLPANYEGGKRYPLIVDVYGGSYRSESVYRFGLSGSGVENLQLLATRGYAVLLPDTPLQKGTPMADLLKTVIPGVDRVVELGIADPDRLGVMGHSYGGYSTLSLIVQTTRFKAAVDSAGPADLISVYGQMDKTGSSGAIGWSETGQGGMVGTPWQFRDRYIENSPIFYLDRVETPLLIVQGELDGAVPHQQAEEVFVGLRRLGKEVVYAEYQGEEHWEGTWSFANASDYWNRVIDWFNQHLKGTTGD